MSLGIAKYQCAFQLTGRGHHTSNEIQNVAGSTWSEYNRGAIPLEVSEHLRVTQKLSEVDVEEVATLLDHAESQHIYRYNLRYN